MRALALCACLLTAACGSFAGGQSRGAPPPGAPLAFVYHAPKTKLTLAGTIKLLDCGQDLDSQVATDITVNVVATAAADPDAYFRIEGDALNSVSQKRDLKLELYENGTLKSLNATSSDRSGAIAVNVLKIIGTIAGIAVGAAPLDSNDGLVCNRETMMTLAQVKSLRSSIEKKRNELWQKPAEAVQTAKQIDALAAKLATIVENKLTIPVSTQIEIPDAPAAGGVVKMTNTVRWSLGDLSQWFSRDPTTDPCTPVSPALFRPANPAENPANKCELVTDKLSLTYTVEGQAVEAAKTAKGSPCSKGGAGCGTTLVLLEPATAVVTVTTNTALNPKQPPGEKLAGARVPISQWGAVTYLPLNVGFAQSRTIGFSFDTFGRRHTFSWASEATAENATGALADIASTGATTLKTLEGPSEVDLLKAENEELEVRQKNAKLKACQATLDAGATECPS